MEDEQYTQYKAQRSQLIKSHKDNIYSDITFSEKEQSANELWGKMLQVDRFGRKHTYYHNYTLQHQATYVQQPIFQVIAKAPKGVTHHTHIDCCVDNDWFINECAYSGNCYLNRQTKFFSYFKSDEAATEGFQNLIKIREELGKEACDNLIRTLLHVTQAEAEDFNSDIWDAFEAKIIGVSQYFQNSVMWPVYIRKVFQNYINEGITRIEGRNFIGWFKDENGQPLPISEEIKIYKEAVQDMQSICPGFSYGMIIQGLKVWDKEELYKYYEQAYELRKQYPELVIAFDMVQEEDAFKDALTLAETLLKQKDLEKKYGIDFPFVFHGGESNDNQLNTNLYDMLLLNSKRIGHGINLVQHSNLTEEIKKRGICLEICILSNQVLRYYTDLRTHPLRSFINNKVPVSLSPDDPGVFGAQAVNHDFYHATIGARLTLQDLKLLTRNSVYHSFLSEQGKNELWAQTEQKWQQFIDWFLQTYNKPEYIAELDKVITSNPPKMFK